MQECGPAARKLRLIVSKPDTFYEDEIRSVAVGYAEASLEAG